MYMHCAINYCSTYSVVCLLNPTPPLHGLLEPSTRDTTNRNITLTFRCKRGFEPHEPVTALCATNNGTWSPNPAAHVCTGECSYKSYPLRLKIND